MNSVGTILCQVLAIFLFYLICTYFNALCSKEYTDFRQTCRILEDETNLDWVPLQNMGHKSQNIQNRPSDVERK